MTICVFLSCDSLKNLDRKKQRQFRGAHPERYQADVVSMASTVRSKSMNTGKALIQEIIERKSQASQRSKRSTLSASQRLQALSTRSSAAQRPMPLLEKSQAANRTGLKEFLNEQAMYEDVVSQIH